MRVGIVASSMIAGEFCKCVNESFTSKLTLECVFSRLLAKAETFAKENDVANFVDDYDEMLDTGIDIVYISSPNSIHYMQAVKAIEAKKHVLIEKPICLTLEEVENLYDLARENNVFIMEALTTLAMDEFQKLRDMIAEEDIKYAELHMMQQTRHYRAYQEGKYINVFDSKMGGGSLYDLGIYLVNPMVNLFGVPREYNSVSSLSSLNADLTTSVQFNYDSFCVNLSTSKILYDPRPSIICSTSKTFLIESLGIMANVKVYDTKGKLLEEFGYEGNKFKKELEHFIEIIESGEFTSDLYTEENTKLSIEIINKINKS